LEQEQNKIAGTFLGFCYEYGIGVRADIKRAFDCQFRASNYGSNLGAAIVGEYYELGIGLDLDLEKSKTYYLQAKEKGAIRGELWSAQRESVEAIERFIQMGSIRAKILLGTYFLGHILPNGVAVPSNKKKSYELLKPLADLGIPEAIYFLGEWYYTREITDTGDDWMKIGFKLFKKSAELGCGPGAPCRVGFCYELGFGTERDLTLAYYWYQKALEGGSKKAPEDLARVQLLLNPV
jgi:TPR repeat protein